MDSDASYSDEIDIRKLILGLIKRKKVIGFGVIICTVAAVVISMMLPPSYTSVGFYSISISTPQFKSYIGMYEDADMLRAFAEKYSPEDDSWAITTSIFKDSFEPIYSFGKNPKNLQKENMLIGIILTCDAESPELAQKRVEILGKYITTNIVNLHLWDYYAPMHLKVRSSIIKHKNDLISSQRSLDYLTGKAELLTDYKGEYDKRVTDVVRQVVQIDEANAKYLPPYQQLFATRMTIHVGEVGLKKIELQLKKDSLMIGFVDGIQGLFDDKNDFLINQSLFQTIIDIKREYFTSLETEDFVREISFSLEAKFSEFTVLNDLTYRFTSGPSLPKYPNGPAKWMVLAGAFLFSLFFLLIYSIYMSWWEGDS